MNEKAALTIIIPAYNEAANLVVILPSLLEFCRQQECKLIIVNDGSTDNTKEILDAHQGTTFFSAIHHKLNKGYGAAIKSGIRASDTDYVITIDADGQHPPEVMLTFIELWKQGYEVVYGQQAGL